MDIETMIAEYEKRLKTTMEQLGLLMRIEQQLLGALTALQQLAETQVAQSVDKLSTATPTEADV